MTGLHFLSGQAHSAIVLVFLWSDSDPSFGAGRLIRAACTSKWTRSEVSHSPFCTPSMIGGNTFIRPQAAGFAGWCAAGIKFAQASPSRCSLAAPLVRVGVLLASLVGVLRDSLVGVLRAPLVRVGVRWLR